MLATTLLAGLALTVQQNPRGPATTSCDVLDQHPARSTSGVVQVSNLTGVRLQIRVPRRPMPPSHQLLGLGAEITVRQIGADGAKTIVPAKANVSGGGGDATTETVYFQLDIPVDPAERDAAIHEYLTALAAHAEASTNEQERAQAATLQIMARSGSGVFAFQNVFSQQRVGSFEIECRVLDGGRTTVSGLVNVDVLFKGRFFDQDAFRIK